MIQRAAKPGRRHASGLADSCFAKEADLGMGAVDGRPDEGVEAALPVGGVGADLEFAAYWIVLNIDEVGDGSLERMADVVDEEIVAIVPAVHVELLH